MGKNAKLKKVRKAAVAAELKLDFGCGKNVREGFEGVDVRDFGQKHTIDLVAMKRGTPEWMTLMPPTPERMSVFQPWPWKDGSVTEAHASHFVEHLSRLQRVHFVNELHRVLKPGGKCQVITPHWASCRAYGDMTHEWPGVSEFWYFYLNKDWRAINAPHNDCYTCDFEIVAGYSLHQALAGRNQEYIQEKLTWAKEAASDTVATFVKKG